MLDKKNVLNAWDRIMMAITFAEAGELDTAQDVLNKRSETRQRPESQPRKEAGRRPELRV